jgi:hypothetical protein
MTEGGKMVTVHLRQPNSLLFMLTLSVSGCASAQVNYNTLDIASTYDQLLTKQVFGIN